MGLPQPASQEGRLTSIWPLKCTMCDPEWLVGRLFWDYSLFTWPLCKQSPYSPPAGVTFRSFAGIVLLFTVFSGLIFTSTTFYFLGSGVADLK